MNSILLRFQNLGITEILDIIVISFLIYLLLIWFKKTRAVFVLTGIIIAAVVYLLARQLNLILTAAVFQGFFAVFLVAVVVIFQEEIRHFFERVAIWGVFGHRFRKEAPHRPFDAEIAILVRTLTDLAEEKTGAILILKGRDALIRHLERGVDLHGELSEPLLKSLFDPHSVGHDGAVILEEGRVLQFSCYLPLSKNQSTLRNLGTRHAAALGLSELSDSLCLVVSEESGGISVARHGELSKIGKTADLQSLLEEFYHELHPRFEKGFWKEFFRRNFLEKVIALCLAIILWLIYV